MGAGSWGGVGCGGEVCRINRAMLFYGFDPAANWKRRGHLP